MLRAFCKEAPLLQARNALRRKAGRSGLRRAIERRIKNGGKYKINFGATNSAFCAPGWETVNLKDGDYGLDLRQRPRLRLPFPDDSIALAYTSHTLEHVCDDNARSFFSEVRRTLVPGGVLRVVVPDMDKVIEAYRGGDFSGFAPYFDVMTQYVEHEWRSLPEEQLEPHNFMVSQFACYNPSIDRGGGPILKKEEVDDALATMDKYEFARWCVGRLEPGRVYNHVNAYDFAKMSRMMTEAGFREVRRSAFRQSEIAELRKEQFDLDRHRMASLYVEAVK